MNIITFRYHYIPLHYTLSILKPLWLIPATRLHPDSSSASIPAEA